MAINNMLLTASIFGLGAVARATLGYANKVKRDPKVEWDWLTFIQTTLPSFGAGFIMGAALTDVPDAFSTGWFTFMITTLLGGVGLGSMQSNFGKVLGKK